MSLFKGKVFTMRSIARMRQRGLTEKEIVSLVNIERYFGFSMIALSWLTMFRYWVGKVSDVRVETENRKVIV